MKQRFLAMVLVAAGLIACPMQARAQDDAVPPEVRLEGYGSGVNVRMEERSSALTWILMVGMAGACIAVMFKNAKRSHLD